MRNTPSHTLWLISGPLFTNQSCYIFLYVHVNLHLLPPLEALGPSSQYKATAGEKFQCIFSKQNVRD